MYNNNYNHKTKEAESYKIKEYAWLYYLKKRVVWRLVNDYTIYQSKAVVTLLNKWNKLIFKAKAFWKINGHNTY